jgi:hypothetical protein
MSNGEAPVTPAPGARARDRVSNILPLLQDRILVSAWTCAIALTVACIVAGAGPWAEAVADFFGKRDPFWVREDFTAFYAAGKLINDGMASQLYDLNTISWVEYTAAGGPVGGSGMLPYFNPPFFGLLFSPLAHLSLQQAYQVWNILCLGLLAINSILLWRLARPLATPWRIVLLAGYLSLYPLVFGLRLGQFSLILQLSIAAGFILLRDGRDRWAGASFALLLIKPELVLPIALYLAVKRRWAVFHTLIPLTVAAIAVSIAMIGLKESLEYPGYLMRSTTLSDAGVAPNLMINWAGLIAASFGHGASTVRPIVAGILGLAGIGAVIWLSTRRSRPSQSRVAFEWLALILATMLADPHFYLQDTIIAVPMAVAALAAMTTDVQRAIAGLMMAASWGIQRLALYPNQVMEVNLFAISLAIIFCAAIAWLWYNSSNLQSRNRAQRRAMARARAIRRVQTVGGKIPQNARRGDAG